MVKSPLDSSGIATSDGHVLHWYDTGGKFLEAEFDAIASARKRILFEHYIFRASPVGDRFRDALTEAARRGVQVTLLLDYVGCLPLPRAYFSEMSDLGGRLIWFNPVRWRFWSFRDHRKILVVDDIQAFIGGCNIAPEYEGDGVIAGWRDGGIAVSGPIMKSLIESFESQVEKAGNRIWRARKLGRSGWVKVSSEVSLLLTRPGFYQGGFQKALADDLLHAQDVAITIAYFLPMGRARQMFLLAAKRARNFRLLLPGKSDVPLMRLASQALYGQFLKRGAKIHEYQPQMLHAKIIIVDDIVYVGSANLDPRSLVINFEVMLRIRSAAFAKQARATFERDIGHSRPVANLSWQRPANWWERLKRHLARIFFTRLDLGVAQFFVRKAERRGADSGIRSSNSSQVRPPQARDEI